MSSLNSDFRIDAVLSADIIDYRKYFRKKAYFIIRWSAEQFLSFYNEEIGMFIVHILFVRFNNK